MPIVKGKTYFGDMQDVESAPDDYDDYAAAAAYGVPARYKDVARPDISFNYDKYMPQDPTYNPRYRDRHHFEGDNRTEQEQQRYGYYGMPMYAYDGVVGPFYNPEVFWDAQGYPQPSGYALDDLRAISKNPRVQLDYRNVESEGRERKKREDWLYNLMRERMKFD